MEITAEHIIGSILAARTLTDEEKTAMLEKFKDPATTNEMLTEMLQKLADSEIALREEENRNLEQIGAENAKELEQEQALIQPEVDAVNAQANAEAAQLVHEFVQQADALDASASKVVETIKRGEHEADQMDAIRSQLGIK